MPQGRGQCLCNFFFFFFELCYIYRYIMLNCMQILELPPKAHLIASSEMTAIEMFSYGDHIFCIQGHPEFTHDILFHFIDRIITRNLVQVFYVLSCLVLFLLICLCGRVLWCFVWNILGSFCFGCKG